MLRAHLTDGRIILGLDAENVRRLKQGKPIMVDLTEIGGTDTVMIMYADTLAQIIAELNEVAGPLPPANPSPSPKGVPS